MIELEGRLFDGTSSRSQPCILRVDGDGLVRLSVPAHSSPLALKDLSVSERVGNIPRSFRFPDGSQFVTGENDKVDSLLARFSLSRAGRFLHKLESRYKAIVSALALVIVSSFIFIQYGIPYLAKQASFALSSKTAASIDVGTLELLDKVILRESRLDEATRRRLRSHFNAMLAGEDPAFRYQLLFRHSRRVGANAFALPSGTIVMTDEMVKIAKHDHELIAVLAHEIAHVRERHALRRLFQSSAMLLIVSTLTGDVSSTTGIVAALPTILIEASYSQAFEREADAYALNYLRQSGIDPVHFKNLMLRIESKYKGRKTVPTFFSTHPATVERVRLFESTAPGAGLLNPEASPRIRH